MWLNNQGSTKQNNEGQYNDAGLQNKHLKKKKKNKAIQITLLYTGI